MSDAVSLRVINLPDFRARLKDLGAQMQKSIVRSGVAAALRVMRTAVRQAVPVGRTRTLKRSIYIKRSKLSSRQGVEYGILRPYTSTKGKIRRGGARAVAKALRQDAFYWRFVEAGHLVRKRGQSLRGGTRSKNLQRARLSSAGAPRVEGRWFLRNSFNRVQGAALAAFNAQVERALVKANYREHIR